MHSRLRAGLGLALLALLLPAIALADTAADPSQPLKVGAAVTEKKPVDIARLAKNPKRFVGRTVRLEGTVKDVCQGMGCWVEVASPTGVSFLAKSLDESVLLPKDCVGRKVVVQGVVKSQAAAGHEVSAEHAEHMKEGHACPTPTYLVATQGVELAPASAAAPAPAPAK